MSFALWTLACAALVAVTASACVGALALALGPWVRRWVVDARAAWIEAACAAPLAAVALIVTATVLPYVLGTDHCAGHAHHPHVCPAHSSGSLPVGLALVTTLFAVRVALRWGSEAASLRRASRVARALAASSRRATDGSWIMPRPEPMAFVLGLRASKVFLSEGLLAAAQRGAADVDVILAHEHAHGRRRDPLRRAVMSLLLAFHLPGIASRLERALARAYEGCADAEAAERVGDRLRVAEAIVGSARLCAATPRWAVAFGAPELERRVHDLVDPPSTGRGFARWLAAFAIALACATLAGSHEVHHRIEAVLGLWS